MSSKEFIIDEELLTSAKRESMVIHYKVGFFVQNLFTG